MVSPELVIWDSTSFYFEGTYDDSEFVTFGYAVEGRTDAKRVRIGICMDAGTGIPLTSSRESGKKPDSELVVDNLETLKATLSKAGRAEYVVVADRFLLFSSIIFACHYLNSLHVKLMTDPRSYLMEANWNSMIAPRLSRGR